MKRSKTRKSWNRLGIFVAIGMAILLFAAMAPAVEAGTYDRYAAANYAWTYALNPNPVYRTFDADCTNFVSQSLAAGGWQIVGAFHYDSSDAWYYYAGIRPYYSNTWAVANDLATFLSRSSRDYPTYLPKQKPYPSSIQIGDVIQVDWQKDGRWDHSMFITGYGSNGDLLISEHTNNRRDVSLSDIMANYPNARFIAWHIRDTY